MLDGGSHGGVGHVRIVAVLKCLGTHDAAKVLVEILASLVVQAVPARRGTGEFVNEGDAQRIGHRVDGLVHKKVEHDGGGFGGRLFLIDARRLDKIDLLLITFAGNDQLTPNIAQAVNDDIRRRIQ